MQVLAVQWQKPGNQTPMNLFAGVGAINGFLAVALAAIGTHALADTASAAQMASFQKATYYQMTHALALIGAGWVASAKPSKAASIAGWAFIVGITLFCGAVYSIGLTGSQILAPAAPVGGTLLMIGWLALAVAAFKRKS